MEALKSLGEARSRSSADLMMYAAIAGRVPTVDPTPPPRVRRGSLRWLAAHCRSAGYATCHSLHRVLARYRDVDVLSISPGDVGSWLVRECRMVTGIAQRSYQAGKQRFQRVH